MRIVILGAPGSGKRTQTDLLANKYGLTPVMTGELVKTAVMERTVLGLEIKGLQDAGRVVTEDLILALLRERLLKNELTNGFVLDGFPRNLLQALTLDELMVEISQPLDLILLLDIETDNLMERLVGRRTCRSCGLLYNVYRNPTVVDGVCDVCGGRLHQRSDDNEETVSSRIHVFEHLISPLITHYEKQDKLVRIDGNGDVDRVFSLICKAIEEGAPRARQETLPEKAPAPAEISPAVSDRAALQGDEDAAKPDSTVASEAAAEEAAAPPGAGNATVRGAKKKTASKQSEKKRTSHGKTSKKVAPSKKTGKKKTVPKKKTTTKKKTTAKKKPVEKKRPTNKQASKKKLSRKKPSGKQLAKKKAKISQAVKKKAKSPQKGSATKSTKQAKKKPAKPKKTLAKRSVSSSAKASAGKSKTGRASSKGVAAKKPAKKVVRKKRALGKPAKKTVKKKGVVKKPVVKKRAAKKAAPKRNKARQKKGNRK
ncbi:MAG: nucleoside monophosphate kinase [Candidatus Thiodiazotropha sp. (ex Ctena orbiculata)]|nr:nucleoside monophosphate kinase [Candidatus Thiodiazotropha taylori]MBT2997126.1 nucleoside monophosphate kinase [Candidatus Thiodiazotropha taylori]MBT3001279.1 nucleoside monophosphate kinase [Candidatus Thiodiazotropha taylori]MBV2107124.1 nucleoside monophosphate kinase [Candidatus Thiodiazotropha taylori]MBV2111651.1 nucleoside monophosphate kinase [Candidatus Thiodiazotropha taylori]